MGEKPLYRTHLIQRRRFRMRRRSEEVEEHRQVPRDDDRAGARVGRERDGVPARVARLRRRQRQHRVQLLAARARRRARRPRPRQQRQILRAYQPRDGRDDEEVRLRAEESEFAFDVCLQLLLRERGGALDDLHLVQP